ncbi:hypothetical protein TIFTF001_035208 [Ficus carica]|uniref:Cytochrome P450 n=1 Tax=Ficus carica TaxID=3494 RepID=A0AA88J9X0_FICCA|nr:hypothetical protein TIFTF001_035208 [Ficus carica]
MNKAQEEIRRVVGEKAKVDMNDINQMYYLKNVVKETMRLHPPAPLLAPRETSSRVQIGGYDVPAKTRVLVNAWAIQRHPDLWERPEEFIPERFENNPIDFGSHDFQLIPFGFGRRRCPGLAFGIASVEYSIANLLYWFDWKLPYYAENMDMTEVYGIGYRSVDGVVAVTWAGKNLLVWWWVVASLGEGATHEIREFRTRHRKILEGVGVATGLCGREEEELMDGDGSRLVVGASFYEFRWAIVIAKLWRLRSPSLSRSPLSVSSSIVIFGEIRQCLCVTTHASLWNDINQMDYLKNVVKETMRLHPPAPLLAPRETTARVQKGYDVPVKTRVLVNAWEIQRHPDLWEKPEEFIPKRFDNNPIDFGSQDFQLIPFGFGIRRCPGLEFGIASVEYSIANLLYWFDWKLPYYAENMDNNSPLTFCNYPF